MMIRTVVLMVVLLCVANTYAAEPERPEWPDYFKAQVKDTYRASGMENVTTGFFYFAYPEKYQRFDYTNQYTKAEGELLEDFNSMRAYDIPKNDTRACYQHEINVPMRLPEFEKYEYMGEQRVAGQDVYWWQHQFGPVVVDYYDAQSTRYPVEFQVTQPHLFFSSVYEFVSEAPIDEDLFDVPLQCTRHSTVTLQ